MPSPTSYRIDGLSGLNPKRILCCQLRQIGDVLLLTPSIHLLKSRFPDAEIDVLTEKKCAPVLENNPEVAHVWALDRKLGLADSLKFYRHVGTGGGRGRYDLIVDFQQLPRIRWVLMLSDARVKLSYPPAWYNRPFYTHWAPVSGPYAAKCKAGVLMHAFGIAWNNDPPRLYLTDAEKTEAAGLLHGWGILPEHTLVTVDATHRRGTRLWPAAHYGRLMALAASVRPDLRFLLLFGPGEEQLVAEVRQLALASGLDAGSLILPEQMLSLRQMAAVQSCAHLHLGNCSSPRHFAVAVDTPTLTVRGSTSNAWTFPGPGHEDISLGLPCQPCNETGCHLNIKCLTDLAPEAVLPRLLAMLEQ
ncbi:MAG: glycosyltransferase family 9 protein [Humidesulfovibrio sp.]|uniref:glycosyltransferase family 9 protein n=1 Tax=Humidesulfovibrio sp. TaxID=2910988 RepID=UPI0027F82C1A|nr:glycosyltransferase family 9 protein [Humidesulfovibrio sp.]MDQ7834837.1 glycosyltransferase family 9 protein [Humidesulfovibrio sp.]